MTSGVAADTALVSSSGTSDGIYSKAFDKLAGENPEDIVGLLAYALSKKGIWEISASGSSLLPRANRDPSPTEIAVYRESARQRLQAFAASAIADVTPEIEKTKIVQAIESAASDIKERITERTHWTGSLVINITAWIASPLITWLIVQSLTLPSIVETVTRAVRAGDPARQEGSGVAPNPRPVQ